MVNQSGWTHEERNIACKKMGSVKEHYDICPYGENLRTSRRAAMMCRLGGRGRRRKGDREHVHCCLNLRISDCPNGPSWSSDSLGFCVFPHPSLLPFACGNPDRGPMPFLRVFASSEGKVKVLSFRASLQVRRQLAWELLGDRETSEPTLKPGPLAKPLSEFVSSSPPVLNSAESPWSSICLRVS